MPEVKCSYCGEQAVLVTGKEIYPNMPHLFSKRIWSCRPCEAYVGTHQNSDAVPLGTLAKAPLRRLRNETHATFDPLWKSGEMSRREAYEWLSEKMNKPFDDTHVAMFTEEECRQAISFARQKLKLLRR